MPQNIQNIRCASPGAVSDNNQEAMVLECSITINYSKTPKFPLLGEVYYRQFDGSTASKSSYYYYYYYVLIITGAYWYKNKCVQNTGTEEKLRSTRSVSLTYYMWPDLGKPTFWAHRLV